MAVTIIAAASVDWGIGRAGKLPWHAPADLARFKRRTLGKTLIVGRKTAESLPKGLPGRRIVTVSRSGDYTSVEAALRSENNCDEVFVAGGSGIFLEGLAYADNAEITRIPGEWNCDAFMPDLVAHGWNLVEVLNDGRLQVERWRP